MVRVREDVMWLLVFVVGFGALGVGKLAQALPHVLRGNFDAGIAVALIIGLTATLLAASALAQGVGLVIFLLRQKRHP